MFAGMMISFKNMIDINIVWKLKEFTLY